MEYTTFPGKTYTVTTPNGCSVYDSDGRTLVTVLANSQAVFVATTAAITYTDSEAVITETFNNAPVGFIGTGGALNGLSDLLYKQGVPTKLIGSHVFDLGTLSAAVDLSSLAFDSASATVRTAEIWLTQGGTVQTVTWPNGATWIDGAPDMTATTAYRFAVRQEPNGNLVINLAYELAL